jgi:hypothetical protein
MDWWLAEALLTIPGQIVQGEKSSIRDEHHVQISVPNNDIIRSLDNFHQWTAVVPRWKRLVVSMNEDLKTWTRQSAHISNTARHMERPLGAVGRNNVCRERLISISLTYRSARSADLPVHIKRGVNNLLDVGTVKIRLIEALW